MQNVLNCLYICSCIYECSEKHVTGNASNARVNNRDSLQIVAIPALEWGSEGSVSKGDCINLDEHVGRDELCLNSGSCRWVVLEECLVHFVNLLKVTPIL